MKGIRNGNRARASPGDGEITDCSCGTSERANPREPEPLSVRNSRAEVAGATFFFRIACLIAGKEAASAAFV